MVPVLRPEIARIAEVPWPSHCGARASALQKGARKVTQELDGQVPHLSSLAVPKTASDDFSLAAHGSHNPKRQPSPKYRLSPSTVTEGTIAGRHRARSPGASAVASSHFASLTLVPDAATKSGGWSHSRLETAGERPSRVFCAHHQSRSDVKWYLVRPLIVHGMSRFRPRSARPCCVPAVVVYLSAW